MGCPVCHNKDAYHSPINGWNCNNPSCSTFDSRIATPAVVASRVAQTVISSAVPQGIPKIIYIGSRDLMDGDGPIRECFYSQDEAERWIADYVLDAIDDVEDLDTRRDILEYIQVGKYNKAAYEFSQATDRCYEVDCLPVNIEPHGYTVERLNNRVEEYLEDLNPEEEDP